MHARATTAVKLERNSEPELNTGCLLWTARLDKQGYGRVKIGNRPRAAHRAAYAEVYGPIPDGLCVCHKCDTPSCINPNHLFLGTIADNNLDRDAKGRTKPACEPSGKLRGKTHEVRRLFESGQSKLSIAKRFGVSDAAVRYHVRQPKP